MARLNESLALAEDHVATQLAVVEPDHNDVLAVRHLNHCDCIPLVIKTERGRWDFVKAEDTDSASGIMATYRFTVAPRALPSHLVRYR